MWKSMTKIWIEITWIMSTWKLKNWWLRGLFKSLSEIKMNRNVQFEWSWRQSTSFILSKKVKQLLKQDFKAIKCVNNDNVSLKISEQAWVHEDTLI